MVTESILINAAECTIKRENDEGFITINNFEIRHLKICVVSLLSITAKCKKDIKGGVDTYNVQSNNKCPSLH